MLARNPANGRKASVLFLVLTVVSALSVFGGVLAFLVHNRFLLSQAEVDRTKALFLAEAGLAQAFYELKTQKDDDKNGLGNIRERKLGDGVFSVVHTPRTSEIRSTGTVNDVSRTVQIKYAAN